METIILTIVLVLSATTLLLFFAPQKRAKIQQEQLKTLTKTEQELAHEQQQNQRLEQQNQTIQAERDRLIHLTAQLQAENRVLQEAREQVKNEILQIQEQSKEQFKNLAAEILEDKSKRFTQTNKEKMDELLRPFGEQIVGFRKLVEESYRTEGQERSALKAVVEEMRKTNEQITQEAKNLTHALKSDSKAQGCWGEMILASILENSGLTKGREYELEETLRDEQGNLLINEESGKRMRPDAVIKFPYDRVVLVDSKVSLNAFVRYHEAKEPEQAQTEALAHVRAVKDRIQELSARGYSDYEKTLDFVMMFVPNESAYYLAMQTDPNLWRFAYEKRVVLVSPMSLLSSLKMCDDLWRRAEQNKNTQEIARRGGLLYDKLSAFVDDMIKLKNRLDGAQNEYDAAFGKLKSGKGNILRQAEELKKLGLATKKQIASVGDPDDTVADDTVADDTVADEPEEAL